MASIQQRSNGTWRAQIYRQGERRSKTFPTKVEAERWASRVDRHMHVRSEAKLGALLSMFPARVLAAIEAADYNVGDVLDGAIHAEQSVGIYFLIREGEVTYIGQTKDVFLRLSKHRRDGRRFDAYNFLHCPESELDRLERMYIEAFMPKENMKF